MRDVDLGEPTSFLDHVYVGCTQRVCKISDDIVASYRERFESTISAGAKEKLPSRAAGKPDAKTMSSWSCDTEGNAQIVWSDIANRRTKQASNCTKSQLHALMTIHSKKENWDLLENCQKVCSEFVLKCLYLARIGRPEILWSVNRLARSITKWTKACDKRLARLFLVFMTQVNLSNIVIFEICTTMQTGTVSGL